MIDSDAHLLIVFDCEIRDAESAELRQVKCWLEEREKDQEEERQQMEKSLKFQVDLQILVMITSHVEQLYKGSYSVSLTRRSWYTRRPTV